MKLILNEKTQFFNMQTQTPVDVEPGEHEVCVKMFAQQEWVVLKATHTGLMKVHIVNDKKMKLEE